MSAEPQIAATAPVPRALSVVTQLLFAVATGLMLIILTLIVAQIAARNVWNMGLPRAEELTRLAGVLTVYLTAPLLALHGQHVAVDVFTGMMRRLPRLACRIMAELSVLAFAVLCMWGGYLYLQRAWRFTTPALGLPNIALYAPILVCFALLILVSLWRIVAHLRAGGED